MPSFLDAGRQDSQAACSSCPMVNRQHLLFVIVHFLSCRIEGPELHAFVEVLQARFIVGIAEETNSILDTPRKEYRSSKRLIRSFCYRPHRMLGWPSYCKLQIRFQ